MKEWNVYFSPTGGTRSASKLLSPKGTEINISKRLYDEAHEFGEDDLVFFSLPSYQGRCPGFALERIRASLKGNDTPAVINACYGAREYEDTLVELHDTISELGFITIAAVSSVTEHSMIREFAHGRPDKNDAAELTSFRERILRKAESRDMTVPAFPGNRPYRETKPNLTPLFDRRRCISCSACAVSCPASAIDPDTFETDTSRCISCMRCVRVCPSEAKYLDPEKLNAVKERIRKACTEHKNNTLAL